MSDYPTSSSENRNTLDISSASTTLDEHEPEDRIARISSNLLDKSDSLIYAIVGICFFLGAIFTLCYSFWDLGSTMLDLPNTVATAIPKGSVTPQSVVARAIIQLISDLLLVLIIMEVLSTVIHYLKERATSLRPFLFIGIISATRGILSIGARLSVEKPLQQDFINDMIELGVSAAVILALGITLKLLGRLVEDELSGAE